MPNHHDMTDKWCLHNIAGEKQKHCRYRGHSFWFRDRIFYQWEKPQGRLLQITKVSG